jgi:hypothetical protein
MNTLGDLLKTLDQMVNDQFESIEFKKFLGGFTWCKMHFIRATGAIAGVMCKAARPWK